MLPGRRSPVAEPMAARVVIEKVMSLSRAEYLSTAVALGGLAVSENGRVMVVLAGGQVEISYREQDPVRLGGLLSLPRAVVTLTFSDVPVNDRSRFLAHFDRTFQRGGG